MLTGKISCQQRGETCTLLKVACYWLRGEQEEARRAAREARQSKVHEQEGGAGAIRERNPHLLACTCSLIVWMFDVILSFTVGFGWCGLSG